jgi:hypothetical protein
MDNAKQDLMNQALHPPIEDLALIETHIRLVESTQVWSDVAILVDEGAKGILVLMLHENQTVSMLRFCLSVEDSVRAVDKLRKETGKILFGSYQGETFTKKDVHSLDNINVIWR